MPSRNSKREQAPVAARRALRPGEDEGSAPAAAHIQQESPVESVGAAAERLRAAGRAALGVTGGGEG